VRELTEIADKIIRPRLERSAGVGQVSIVGGLERTVNVDIDAERLAALGIPITAVRDAIVRQNADVPGGNVTGPQREQVLRTMGRLRSAEAFNDVIIDGGEWHAHPRARRRAAATDGTREQRSSASPQWRARRQPRDPASIRRQHRRGHRGRPKQEVEALRSLSCPPGAKLEIIRDQSNYIYAALHEIEIHLVLGSILASLVVLAFMRSWRSTLIAGVAIPASVVSTFGVMWALDFTLNSVTMLALVLMVGIVIDDAIVVLENIYKLVEEQRHAAHGGREARHRRDRPRRARHHALARGHLRSGLVHVVDLRAVPVSSSG
jgi:HAE1 family hydrophobic/amphiphilic exporter-1